MKKHYEIRVHGRVQGVGFRYNARKMARSLNLKGWVKNEPDGSVLTAVEGEVERCNRYIYWCRQGPGYGWVERIEVTEKEPAGFRSFNVRY